MSNKSKRFCLIPAKAASTRLKKKNILKLDGKELIYYPINNAIESGLFEKDEIFLSTESEEIKNIAIKYGANVPYLRDEKLTRDPYGVIDVVLDFLEKFPKYKMYESACILLPTAPLMVVEDILVSYQKFEEGNCDVLMSLTENDHSAYRAVLIEEKGTIKPMFDDYIHKQSTEIRPTYRINGAVVIVNVQKFMAKRSYFLENWKGYIMPRERSVDIDDQSGLNYARYLKQSIA